MTVTMIFTYIIQKTYKTMNWTNYTDIYDLYINGKKVRRIWGLKHAIAIAESQSGSLFEERTVWLVNIHTGLEIYNNKKGGVSKN